MPSTNYRGIVMTNNIRKPVRSIIALGMVLASLAVAGCARLDFVANGSPSSGFVTPNYPCCETD